MNAKQMIFVINLEHRVDRRIAMLEQLSLIGWHAEFFPAVRPESAENFPSIGARGCFLSHLEVLRTARDAGTKQLVILEDDLNFASDFAAQWKLAMAALEREKWSIFYPGHGLQDLLPGLSLIPTSTAVQCTHFMLINSHAFPKLISGLEAILSRPAGHRLGGPMHVDGAYSTIRRQDHSLTTFANFPVLGYQRPSPTDVGNSKWFDRVGALTPLVKLARKLKST